MANSGFGVGGPSPRGTVASIILSSTRRVARAGTPLIVTDNVTNNVTYWQTNQVATNEGWSMSIEGNYEPSPSEWVRNQVETYESSGGTRANTLRDTGLPIIIVTTVGNKSGSIRKTPLMRVEHDGQYALVASQGGAPTHPVWYYNLVADPDSVGIQDGPAPFPVAVHQATGDDRSLWWERAVAAFPPYAEYQKKTERTIPVFIASRKL